MGIMVKNWEDKSMLTPTPKRPHEGKLCGVLCLNCYDKLESVKGHDYADKEATFKITKDYIDHLEYYHSVVLQCKCCKNKIMIFFRYEDVEKAGDYDEENRSIKGD